MHFLWRRRPTCPRGSRRSSSPAAPAWWTSPARSGSPIPPTTRPGTGSRTCARTLARRATGSGSRAPGCQYPARHEPGVLRDVDRARRRAAREGRRRLSGGDRRHGPVRRVGHGRKGSRGLRLRGGRGRPARLPPRASPARPEIEQTVLRHASMRPIAFAPVLVPSAAGSSPRSRSASPVAPVRPISRARCAPSIARRAVRARPRRGQGDGEGRAPRTSPTSASRSIPAPGSLVTSAIDNLVKGRRAGGAGDERRDGLARVAGLDLLGG